jgi:hypothetical protein
MRLAGLFDKTIAEVIEMAYQYTNVYIFDSAKYQKTFGDAQPTQYEQGMREIVKIIMITSHLSISFN